MPRRRGLSDQPHRPVAGAGEEFRDADERHRDDDAGYGSPEQAKVKADKQGDDQEAEQRENGAGEKAAVKRAHDPGARAEPHEPGADHGGDDRDCAEHERIQHKTQLPREQQAAEQHGGNRGDGVGLKQVRRHAGAIADVVPDVVGNHGGVARIVLRDARLYLADQIGAHVCGLGVDAAAKAGKDTDQAGAEGQPDQRLGLANDPVGHRNPEQSKSYNE